MINEVKVVTEAIKNDPSLYIAYQAGISMAFKDEYGRAYDKAESNCGMCERVNLDIHEIANQAAKNFLDLWIK